MYRCPHLLQGLVGVAGGVAGGLKSGGARAAGLSYKRGLKLYVLPKSEATLLGMAACEDRNTDLASTNGGCALTFNKYTKVADGNNVDGPMAGGAWHTDDDLIADDKVRAITNARYVLLTCWPYTSIILVQHRSPLSLSLSLSL